MRPELNEPVSVLASYSHKTKLFRPLRINWNGLDYDLGKIDFYHKTKQGLVTLHHFSLADTLEQMYFKLSLDTDTLHWTLDEFMSFETRGAG